MAGRVVKIAAKVLAGLAGLMALLMLAAWIVLSTDAFRTWLVDQARAGLKDAAGLELSVGRLGGSLLFGVELENVTLDHGDKRLVSVKKLSASYNPLAALGGRIRVGRLTIEDPQVTLPFTMDDTGPSTGGGLPPLAVTLNNIRITGGRLAGGGDLGPVRLVENLDLAGRMTLDARGLKAEAVLARARVTMDGLDRPVEAGGKAFWSGMTLKVEDFRVSEGPNTLNVDGGLDVDKLAVIKAKVAAQNLEPAALPFAWPLPDRPQGGVALSVAADGPLEGLSFDIGIRRAKGGLKLSGNLDVFGGKASIRGDLDGLDLAAWGILPGPATATGSLLVSEDRWAWEPGARGEVRLDLAPWQAPGLVGENLNLVARLDGGELDVETLTAAGPWGSLSGRGGMGLPGLKDNPRVQARLEFKNLSPPDLAKKQMPAEFAGLKLAGSLELDGGFDDMRIDLELGPSSLAPGQEIRKLTAQGALRQGTWQLSRANLESDWLTLEATGEMGPKGGECYFNLATHDMAEVINRLAALGLMPKIALAGALTATGRVSGPWDKAQVQGRVVVEGLVTKNATARRLTVDADVRDVGPKPSGTLSVTTVDWVSGDMELNRAQLDLKMDQPDWALELAAHGPYLDASFSLSGKAPFKLPLSARLRGLKLTPRGLETWAQKGEVALTVGEDRINISRLIMASGEQGFELEGYLMPDGRVSAQVEAKRVVLPTLWANFEDLPPETRLDLSAQMDGTLEEPRAKVSGKVRGLNWHKLPRLVVRFSGSYGDKEVNLAGKATSGGKELLDLSARAGLAISLRPPVWEPTETGLEAHIRGEKLPLNLIQPFLTGISGVQGLVDLDLTARGTLDKPVLGGNLALAGGAFTIDALSQPVSDIEIDILLDDRRVTVKKARAVSRGELTLSGGLVLPLDGPGSVDLELASRGFLVSLASWGQVLVDLDVKATGPATEPTVSGEVRPTRALVTLGLAAPSGLEDVVFLKPGEAPPPIQRMQTAFNPTGYLGAVTIDVAADFNHGFRLEMDDGWLRLKGRVTVNKPKYQPMVYGGGIQVDQGAFIVKGKRFQIQRGTVDFGNRTVPNPTLNVEAELSTGQYLIYITIAGTAKNPQLQLASQPPMSQPDILSTIIFGRPANSLSAGEGQQLSGTALAFLGEAGRAEMARLFGPDLAPDVVTVYNSGGSAGSALEAGKYISSDLYLRYRHDIQGDGQDVGVDYRLNRYFSIETQVGTSQNTGADLILNYDFD